LQEVMARRGLVQDDVVDVVEGLPDLLDLLSPERVATARRALRARTMLVRKGRWDAEQDGEYVEGGIGFLVLDGALIRCVSAAHRTSGELLGPGDLLRPDSDVMDEIAFGTYWRAISDTKVALLDARFARTATFVPETVPALMASVARRTGAVSRQLVVVQSQAVESRILTTLNYLADRWGIVTAEGLVLPSFLSHGTLALLLGARRPSVTSAMVRLGASGQVIRRPDGRWLLPAHAQVREAEPAAA
jgi:CRP-like cAMP-binding protein